MHVDVAAIRRWPKEAIQQARQHIVSVVGSETLRSSIVPREGFPVRTTAVSINRSW
jgi:hypothetical protein